MEDIIEEMKKERQLQKEEIIDNLTTTHNKHKDKKRKITSKRINYWQIRRLWDIRGRTK